MVRIVGMYKPMRKILLKDNMEHSLLLEPSFCSSVTLRQECKGMNRHGY